MSIQQNRTDRVWDKRLRKAESKPFLHVSLPQPHSQTKAVTIPTSGVSLSESERAPTDAKARAGATPKYPRGFIRVRSAAWLESNPGLDVRLQPATCAPSASHPSTRSHPPRHRALGPNGGSGGQRLWQPIAWYAMRSALGRFGGYHPCGHLLKMRPGASWSDFRIVQF